MIKNLIMEKIKVVDYSDYEETLPGRGKGKGKGKEKGPPTKSDKERHKFLFFHRQKTMKAKNRFKAILNG